MNLNPGSIRRLILTLATGYLTIYGIRQIPYEFKNEWLVIVPALIVAYALTVWIEGLVFKEDAPAVEVKKKPQSKKTKEPTRGFGSN